MKEIAIYIHIPFCDHKCIYCDFYSITKTDNVGPFLNALKLEILNSREHLIESEITSIFFGGGTPSLLSSQNISRIINVFYSNFNISKNIEITLETNPGTVKLEKLKEFKNIGINRLSIGVQSFDDRELKFLTRIHDKDLAIETIKNGSKAGFENINLDLIFNLPKQTREIWELNLKTALELPITHISAYSLILERGTILNKLILDKKVKMNEDDFDATLYETTIEYLSKNKFNQYEVSNFCVEGFECAHNLAYWQHKNYLGFGPSAHSFYENKRWWNFSGVKQYINKIEENGNAICSDEILSADQLLDEFVMLALRSNGLGLETLEKKFGSNWYIKNKTYINELKKNKYIIERENFIKFTSKGYLLCDEILLQFK
ncbi:MAG: radical SAM family heme chaperone HemW [Bacteroidetes bacterium]|nr:radical SAM family heme chaperone HemW [Bacteroidota bacterium]MBU1114300.1 radical SAM family heme chaperone HemW [Bacteroidota bacterium]MBU1799415.1 radical SAM family heme chaperone HemW [Bacteroidota bacterium]